MDPQQIPVSRAAVAVVAAGQAGSRAADELQRAGVSDVVVLERTVLSALFDEATDTWVLETSEGRWPSRVIVAADEQNFVPWIPGSLRVNDFRGPTCHSTTWDPVVDPTGKRIGVIGGDAAGGQLIAELTARGAAVQAFGYPPRRIVPALTRRRDRRERHGAEVVPSPVDALTSTGIRTGDGAQHDVDVVVFATGFSVPDGSPLTRLWRNGMEPYAGVAVHGCPNYFWLTGPDHDAQIRHIVECLQLMNRVNATRIEVRRSSQQVFNERVHSRPPRPHPVAHAYDVSSHADRAEQAYEGAATLTINDIHRRVHVRLTGNIDPLDGKYHWQGTILDPLPSEVLRRTRQATLDAGARRATARITEQTAQGLHSIAGVGTPPFALVAPASALSVPAGDG